MARRLGCLVCVCLMSVGCSESAVTPEPDDPAPLECEGLLLDTGECVAVGPGTCAEGFLLVDGGCFPVRPEVPCGDDEVAFVGETTCHPVVDCGVGPWPAETPMAGEVIYVDAAQVAGDGSEPNPYGDLAEAIQAAPGGATLLLAAGSYEGMLIDKPLTIVGRCPTMVRLTNLPTYNVAYAVVAGGAGSVLRGVTLEDGVSSAAVVVSEGVSLQSIIAEGGIVVSNVQGPASLEIRDSLLERGAFVFADGATLAVDRIVSRHRGDGPGLSRVVSVPSSSNGAPSALMVSRSIFEDVDQVGVLGTHGVTEVVASAVRGRPGAVEATGLACGGIFEGMAAPTSATFEDVTVEGFSIFGAGAAACALTIRRATLVGAQPPEDELGVAVVASDPTASLSAENVLVDGAITSGVQVSRGAQAGLARLHVRRTLAGSSGNFGDAVALIGGSVTLSASLAETSARAAVANFGGTLEIRDTTLRCNPIDLSVQDYDGVGQLVDAGGNQCGCEEPRTCQAISAQLDPPEPVEGPTP
jgi:hypothetical protein